MKKLLIILAVIFLYACVKLTSGKRFQNDYIVMSGNIFAGEYITLKEPIFIGKTIDVNDINIVDLFVYNAKVYILDKENKNRQDLIFGAEIDENIFNVGYYDPTESFMIESGRTYLLVAIVGQDSVWAETTVPDPFSILENEGFTDDKNSDFPEIVHSRIDDLYPIKLKVSDQDEKAVYIEYYCLEDWENAFYILSDYLGEKPQSALEYENTMSGSPRKNTSLNIYLPKEDQTIETINNQFHFIFYGSYKVSVHIVDDNFLKYRYKSMGYFHGGINNGIGFFGSMSRKLLYTNINPSPSAE